MCPLLKGITEMYGDLKDILDGRGLVLDTGPRVLYPRSEETLVFNIETRYTSTKVGWLPECKLLYSRDHCTARGIHACHGINISLDFP
jgi:hypothetical protein